MIPREELEDISPQVAIFIEEALLVLEKNKKL